MLLHDHRRSSRRRYKSDKTCFVEAAEQDGGSLAIPYRIPYHSSFSAAGPRWDVIPGFTRGYLSLCSLPYTDMLDYLLLFEKLLELVAHVILLAVEG